MNRSFWDRRAYWILVTGLLTALAAGALCDPMLPVRFDTGDGVIAESSLELSPLVRGSSDGYQGNFFIGIPKWGCPYGGDASQPLDYGYKIGVYAGTLGSEDTRSGEALSLVMPPTLGVLALYDVNYRNDDGNFLSLYTFISPGWRYLNGVDGSDGFHIDELDEGFGLQVALNRDLSIGFRLRYIQFGAVSNDPGNFDAVFGIQDPDAVESTVALQYLLPDFCLFTLPWMPMNGGLQASVSGFSSGGLKSTASQNVFALSLTFDVDFLDGRPGDHPYEPY